MGSADLTQSLRIKIVQQKYFSSYGNQHVAQIWSARKASKDTFRNKVVLSADGQGPHIQSYQYIYTI